MSPPAPPAPDGGVDEDSREPTDPTPPDIGGPTTGGEDIGGPTTGGENPDGPTTGGDDDDGPTTGGEDIGGPTTGASSGDDGRDGPSAGDGGPGSGPTTGGARANGERRLADGPARDHWSWWWFANRNALLDLDSGSRATRTPSTARRADAELWRAESRFILERALTSDDSREVAAAAALALGRTPTDEAAPLLMEALLDTKRDHIVREAAALALGLLPSANADVGAALEAVAELDDGDDVSLRTHALYGIGFRQDETAVPFLMNRATTEPRWEPACAAATAIGLSGHEDLRVALEALLRTSRDKSDRADRVRVYAAQGLARLGDPGAVPALIEAVSDSDPQVRRAAVYALGTLTDASDEATEKVLLRVLGGKDDQAVRNAAAISLGRIGYASAATALDRVYRKGTSRERPFAALGLGLLARKTDDVEVVSRLRRDLESTGSADERGALAVALGIARDTAAAPVLSEFVASSGEPVARGHAAVAVGLLGDVEGSRDALRTALWNTHDAGLQGEVALGLSLLGDGHAVALLVELATQCDCAELEGASQIALGRLGGERAAKALTKILRDEKRPARARAMAAAGLGLALDRERRTGLAAIPADLEWESVSPEVQALLRIL